MAVCLQSVCEAHSDAYVLKAKRTHTKLAIQRFQSVDHLAVPKLSDALPGLGMQIVHACLCSRGLHMANLRCGMADQPPLFRIRHKAPAVLCNAQPHCTGREVRPAATLGQRAVAGRAPLAQRARDVPRHQRGHLLSALNGISAVVVNLAPRSANTA